MDGSLLLHMAIENGAALASTYVPQASIGSLRPGAEADLVLIDYKPPTPITSQNLPWHILFGMQPGMVDTTIVAGKVLMKDRQLTTLDEKESAGRARELAPKVWSRYFEAVRQ